MERQMGHEMETRGLWGCIGIQFFEGQRALSAGCRDVGSYAPSPPMVFFFVARDGLLTTLLWVRRSSEVRNTQPRSSHLYIAGRVEQRFGSH